MKKTVFKSIVFSLGAAVLYSCASGSSQTVSSAAAEEVINNVEVTEAKIADVPQQSQYSSTVEAFAVNNIAPQTSGRIRKIFVEIGDYVSKGQVLAEMDRVQLDQTALQLQNDSTEYVRIKTLYEQGGVSRSDFEAVELGYKVRKKNYDNLLENTILRSPLTGYVTARNYDTGDLYTMAQPLFTIQQVLPVKLLVGISESEYSKVKKGDKVDITVDALPGRHFEGKVNRLYPTIDAATHTFQAEVLVANTDKILRPGMYSRVTVTFGTNRSILLPDKAVVKQEGTGQKFVYTVNADNTVNFVPVTIGVHEGFSYEILDGIKEGEKVVVNGASALRHGAKVNILNK